ncbi:hypothetical protein J5N97_013027 [Dioscorea zingiberensis]|uniref:Uncharacterized protein n=1 Tax=Dioscorea zingiberensis TaxID=325984 RepID=A0A9D5HIE1_9LILI|nr:hypothetical protein J5N97_013027 [Dioscorea zingiberensis]
MAVLRRRLEYEGSERWKTKKEITSATAVSSTTSEPRANPGMVQFSALVDIIKPVSAGMGTSNSKIEDDKALVLCRERKRLVSQALDGRCLLADAHVSYIRSLRNTGTALRNFVELVTPADSFLCKSTSVTHEPFPLAEKSALQFSNSSSSFSRHMETVESFSPVPSPLNPVQFHANHMKAGRSIPTTVKEKPPVPVTAALQAEENAPKGTVSQSEENSTAETPPILGTSHWDYFELPHLVDSHYTFQDGRGLYHELDNAGYIRHLREEEGIPQLEEDGENVSRNARDDFVDSEDDFDQPSTAPLVRIFRNRNEVLDSNSIKECPIGLSVETVTSETEPETEQHNEQQTMLSNGTHDEKLSITTPKAAPAVVLPVNGSAKGHGFANNIAVKDFISLMMEIEVLFLKASESGKEVPRMLEANKLNFRPLSIKGTEHKSGATAFLTSCFGCCAEEVHLPEETAPNDVKYLTWHRSASSLSSSSRNIMGATSKDDVEEFNDNDFNSICMNAGSHASTLDRLYAWERKLYDEVKASGIIRKNYEMKCRLLRSQESKAESPYKIDKTRAMVKDLHSRILVALHRIDSISKKIEELRDKELQPQLEELIGGLIRMWEKMLDCHKHQYNILLSLCNNGTTGISVMPESHQQAVLLLEFELNSLGSNFTKWISAHKSYLEAINGWLHKCVYPLRHKSSRRRKNLEFSPRSDGAPPIFVTCGDWLEFLNDKDFPTRKVEVAIQALVGITVKFLPHQAKSHGNISKFSLSRKEGRSEELEKDIWTNETPEELSQEPRQDLDSLLSGLVIFIDQLKIFAESSLDKYVALQKSIDAARNAYEKY